MLSQITLVYNLRSQYIFNDLPRKRQLEFMDLIDGPPRMISPELFNL